MGKVQDDVLYEWNNIPRRVTLSSFYMDVTEIRNVDYKEYIHWLSRVFGMNNPQVVRAALPDTLVWRDPMAYNEPYVEYYFRHPSFNEYPVVGVNWLQASDYCLWRTDRVNEMVLVNMGHIELSTDQQDERNFNTEAYMYGLYTPNIIEPIPSLNPNEESRLVSMEDGILLPNYRLYPPRQSGNLLPVADREHCEELVWDAEPIRGMVTTSEMMTRGTWE